MPFSFGHAYDSSLDGISKVPGFRASLTNPFVVAIIITIIIFLIVLFVCFHSEKSMRKKMAIVVALTLLSTTIILVLQDSLNKLNTKKQKVGSGTNYINGFIPDDDNVAIEPLLREGGNNRRIEKYDDSQFKIRQNNNINYNNRDLGNDNRDFDNNDNNDRNNDFGDLNYDGSHNLGNFGGSTRDAMQELNEVMGEINNRPNINQNIDSGSSMLNGTVDIDMNDEKPARFDNLNNINNNQSFNYEVIKSTNNSERELAKFKMPKLIDGLKDL